MRIGNGYMNWRSFYLCAAIVGTVVPWAFFASHFAASGFSIAAFIQALFANGAAAGFSIDVLISIVVFWVWAWHDARQLRVVHWWLIFPAGVTVGLSLAMPLYFFLRVRSAAQLRQPKPVG